MHKLLFDCSRNIMHEMDQYLNRTRKQAYVMGILEDRWCVRISWSALPALCGRVRHWIVPQDTQTSTPVFQLWKTGLKGNWLPMRTQTNKMSKVQSENQENQSNWCKTSEPAFLFKIGYPFTVRSKPLYYNKTLTLDLFLYKPPTRWIFFRLEILPNCKSYN